MKGAYPPILGNVQMPGFEVVPPLALFAVSVLEDVYIHTYADAYIHIYIYV